MSLEGASTSFPLNVLLNVHQNVYVQIVGWIQAAGDLVNFLKVQSIEVSDQKLESLLDLGSLSRRLIHVSGTIEQQFERPLQNLSVRVNEPHLWQ